MRGSNSGPLPERTTAFRQPPLNRIQHTTGRLSPCGRGTSVSPVTDPYHGCPTVAVGGGDGGVWGGVFCFVCRSTAVCLAARVLHFRLFSDDRPVFRRIAEDKTTVEDAPLHPRVAGEIFHLQASAAVFVRTTPTAAHRAPLKRGLRRGARTLHCGSDAGLPGRLAPAPKVRCPEGRRCLSLFARRELGWGPASESLAAGPAWRPAAGMAAYPTTIDGVSGRVAV